MSTVHIMTWKSGQRIRTVSEVRLHLKYLAQLNILSTIEVKLYHTENNNSPFTCYMLRSALSLHSSNEPGELSQ